MSDLLSQDQIDALLQAQDSDSDLGAIENDVGGSAESSTKNYGALSGALNLFCEQASSVISTVLNRDVKWSTEGAGATDTSAIGAAVPTPRLLLTMGFDAGLTGQFHMVIDAKLVALLSDLMMMGDGSAPYSEDHKDAITELLNQVMGSCTTPIGERVGDAVSVSATTIAELDLNSPPFPFEGTDSVMLNVAIAGFNDAKVGIVVTDELSGQLMEAFGDAGAEQSGASAGGGGSGSVGLNAAELEDLAGVTSDLSEGDSGGGFGDMFAAPSVSSHPKENVDMLLDVELDVQIELGRADLSIKRILELAPGSVVELDRMAGEPVDLLVNNKVVAKGEVVVVDENFGIRIVSLVSAEERIKSLR